MVARESPTHAALVIVRVAIGALLLIEAHELWTRGVGAWIAEDTAYRVAEGPDWYATFAHALVLRFPSIFAWLVFGGLLAAGASYFVGAFVRPASVGLVILMANVIAAGPRSRREYAMLIAACALACFAGDAGKRFGLDGWRPQPAPRLGSVE